MERFVLVHRVMPSAREEDFDPESTASWVRSVGARFMAAGGVVVGAIGGGVCALFEVADVNDAVELGLSLLDEAERARDHGAPPRIALGAAVGYVEEAPDGLVMGAALDRAHLLASHARVGEFVFDPPSRDLAMPSFLFRRTVATDDAQVRGHSIDRGHSRLWECRIALAHVHEPPVLSFLDDALANVAELASADASALVVLRGPAGAGVKTFLGSLRERTRPGLVLVVPGTPGGLEPFGSLRLALTHAFGAPDTLARELSALSNETRSDLVRVARGEPAPLSRVAEALAELFGSRTEGAGKPWVVAEPLEAVDVSTLEALAYLASNPDARVFVLLRGHDDSTLPTALFRCTTLHEASVPRLTSDEARSFAENVLGPATDAEITRRLATLGGDTPLAILELARAMVASGDLVRRGRGFAWRASPRTGAVPLMLSAILAERIASLETGPLRALELVCAAPAFADETLLSSIAALDSISEETLDEALTSLVTDRFVTRGEHVAPSNEALRSEVLRLMPPSRLAELHRFLAEVEGPRFAVQGSFAQATLGHYVSEGGHGEEGARLLLEASLLAARAEHARSAVRLAAEAVRANPSNEVRDVSARIMREVVTASHAAETTFAAPSQAPLDHEPTPAEAPAFSIAASAIRALLDRDFDRVERCIDLAVAEGGSLAAAGRFRAVAALCRGDRGGALAALARTRTDDESSGERARDSIARSWFRLSDGNVHEAIRMALRALAAARTASDSDGEAAALHTLAACYRLLGRDDDAARLRVRVG